MKNISFKYPSSALFAMLLFTSAANAQNCEPGERALYKGLTEKKQVLICASPAKPPFQKIEYRFGTADKVELTYMADKANGKKFYAGNEAIDQRASINYLWFNNGDTQYSLFECWGGNCPSQNNLLVVSKGKKILAKIKLKEGSFDIDDVTDFNKSTDNLIQIKDTDGFTLFAK
jgi:hypothetical protein